VTSWRGPLLAVVMVVATGGLVACSPGASKDMVIGVPRGTPSTTSARPQPLSRLAGAPGAGPSGVFVDDGEDFPTRPEPGGRGLFAPDGGPWGAALPFSTSHAVPDDLVFVLVAGSDARPGEDLTRTRADSLHLLAVHPESRQGTVVGFPRDSWVEIPGHGRGKINNALALGGPDLLSATVSQLTGLPVDYYVLTGFVGLAKMVDELGGVDVFVERRMNDRASGARFQRGWHRFNGAEALAYSRDRNDVAQGDFTRSEHQGVLMLSALAKMRSEVGDDDGVARWVGVLLRHARLDVPLSRLPALGALARRLDPNRLDNVVAPGKLGTAGGQSVVFLTTAAARLFEDLRSDAVVGEEDPAPPPEPKPATTTTTTSTTTSTTTGPAPSTTTSRPGVPGLLR
jgi:polyisoprenyl-teichoic acid--peptidoglycan teichoic acid transferase